MHNNQLEDVEEREPTPAELIAEEEELAHININNDELQDSIGWLCKTARNFAQYSDDEHERIVSKNIPLVIFFAKRYRDKGLPFLDLIQEGNIGLIKAIEKHDPEKGKLSTYASWWIKQRIMRALSNQARIIRLPVSAYAKRAQIKRTATELGQRLGRRPSLVEICSEVGCSFEDIADTFSGSGVVTQSLDAPISEDEKDGTRVGDTIASEGIPSPDEALMEKERTEGLDSVVKGLDKIKVSNRDRALFQHHYNLGSEVKIHRTLESTGDAFKLTRERARQILKTVTQKLRRKNGASPAENSGTDIHGRKKRRKSFSHVRASLAFAQWKPKDSGNRIQSVFDFVTFAYELGESDLLSSKRDKVTVWAQQVTAFMLHEDIHAAPRVIEDIFPDSLTSAGIVLLDVKHVLKTDPIVRRDVEGLRAHFKNIMRLPT